MEAGVTACAKALRHKLAGTVQAIEEDWHGRSRVGEGVRRKYNEAAGWHGAWRPWRQRAWRSAGVPRGDAGVGAVKGEAQAMPEEGVNSPLGL